MRRLSLAPRNRWRLAAYRLGLPRRPPKPLRPIVLFSYHKAGTVLLHKVFTDLCTLFGWRFAVRYGRQDVLPAGADVILFAHSLIDPTAPDLPPFSGIRFMRDPRDVIVSGYLYHRRCREAWCINENLDPAPPIRYPQVPHVVTHYAETWKQAYLAGLGGRSYQANLLALSQKDGLLFEMARYAGWTIEAMAAWPADVPHVRDVRFEAVMANYSASWADIFTYLGLDGAAHRAALRVAAYHDLGRKGKRQLTRLDHVTSRTTTRWPAYFEPVHLEAFRARFGDALARLGYPDFDQQSEGWDHE